MEEVVVIGFCQDFEIVEFNLLLVGMTSRSDSVKKDLRFCLKKDDEVRSWDLSVEKLIDLRV